MKQKSNIMRKSFNFLRNDIILTAEINSVTGKQTLKMEKINLKTGEIELEDYIDCIHTAVIKISPEKYNEVKRQQDQRVESEFNNDILTIRSTEKLKKINLSSDEKFHAFCSWVQGIAEVGINAFKIQSEIENGAKLAYPLSGKLIRFVAMVDPKIMLEYISKLERDCKYEGVKHESSLIMNLDQILHGLNLRTEEIDATDYVILKAIIDIEPPLKLFLTEYNAEALKFSITTKITNFNKFFNSNEVYIKKNIAKNRAATEFEQFKLFLSNKTEQNFSIRIKAASNLMAVRFNEYQNFLSERTEPSTQVRLSAALNENAALLDGYVNFMSFKTEKNEAVRAFASINKRSTELDQYVNFLSIKTEPSLYVRSLAAINPRSCKFKEFANFLNYLKEPEESVRMEASINVNAVEFFEFRNFLNIKTEPSENVRLRVANNPKALKFPEFNNLLNDESEPSFDVRNAANKTYHIKKIKK